MGFAQPLSPLPPRIRISCKGTSREDYIQIDRENALELFLLKSLLGCFDIFKQKAHPVTKAKMFCKNYLDFAGDFNRKVSEVQGGLTCHSQQKKGSMCNQSRPWSWGLSFILQKTWKDYFSCQRKNISKLQNVVTRPDCSLTSSSIIRQVWVCFIFPLQVVELIVQVITAIMPPVNTYSQQPLHVAVYV